MAKLIGRAQILRAARAFEDSDVPELGGTVRVAEFTEQDRRFIATVSLDKPEGRDIRLEYVLRSLVDTNFERLFGDDEADELLKLGWRVVHKLFLLAERVNTLPTLDEVTSDLKKAVNGASSSNSPVPFAAPSPSLNSESVLVN